MIQLNAPRELSGAQISAGKPMRGRSTRETWLAVAIFALAMAWVESAVVFYLRTMIDRIVPYQSHPLPISGARLGPAELIREAATLIMLATVGWLAGATWRSRIAYGLIAFGLWDLAYYVWLIPLTDWPVSIADWDILFLLPLPWWGPVWAPGAIAVLMCLFGTLIVQRDTHETPFWPRWRTLALAVLGIFIALYVFMADAIRLVLSQSHSAVDGLRHLLPVWFNWPLFVLALVLMAVPIVDLARRHRS